MGREHYLNADFDLSLRRTPPPASLVRRARELELLALLGGGRGDSVLLTERPPDEFMGYLEGAGIEVPDIEVLPEVSADATFVPWGWNGEAMELSRRYGEAAPHPDLAVVERVNARRFGSEVERARFADEVDFGIFRTWEELRSFVVERETPVNGWVVKGDHGNAGFANRRLRDLGPEAQRVVEQLLRETGAVQLERWCERSLDFSTTFDLARDGAVSAVELHEVLVDSSGVFRGAILGDTSSLRPFRSDMEVAAAVVAECLHAAGYFGAVTIDSFAWRGTRGEQLRPLVDLNARQSMSAPIERFRRRVVAGATVLWRFYRARSLGGLDCATWNERLGPDRFRGTEGRGALLGSPFVRPDGAPVGSVAVLFVGRDRTDVVAREERFRRSFCR